MQEIGSYVQKGYEAVEGFVVRNGVKVAVGAGGLLGATSAHAEDASTGLQTAVSTASTMFTSVTTLAVSAITFALVTKYLRRGAK